MYYGNIMEDLIRHKKALLAEINYLKMKLKTGDNENFCITISVMEGRVKDIEDFIDGIHRRAYERLRVSDQG